jgi:uncharacterized protein (TIGR03084 family)
VRGVPPPVAFRIELAGPDGESWTWGPQDADQSVRGTAEDFALLVTRMRHRSDLGLVAVGAEADRWLDIAQAFEGDPGRDPGPRTAVIPLNKEDT